MSANELSLSFFLATRRRRNFAILLLGLVVGGATIAFVNFVFPTAVLAFAILVGLTGSWAVIAPLFIVGLISAFAMMALLGFLEHRLFNDTQNSNYIFIRNLVMLSTVIVGLGFGFFLAATIPAVFNFFPAFGLTGAAGIAMPLIVTAVISFIVVTLIATLLFAASGLRLTQLQRRSTRKDVPKNLTEHGREKSQATRAGAIRDYVKAVSEKRQARLEPLKIGLMQLEDQKELVAALPEEVKGEDLSKLDVLRSGIGKLETEVQSHFSQNQMPGEKKVLQKFLGDLKTQPVLDKKYILQRVVHLERLLTNLEQNLEPYLAVFEKANAILILTELKEDKEFQWYRDVLGIYVEVIPQQGNYAKEEMLLIQLALGIQAGYGLKTLSFALEFAEWVDRNTSPEQVAKYEQATAAIRVFAAASPSARGTHKEAALVAVYALASVPEDLKRDVEAQAASRAAARPSQWSTLLSFSKSRAVPPAESHREGAEKVGRKEAFAAVLVPGVIDRLGELQRIETDGAKKGKSSLQSSGKV